MGELSLSNNDLVASRSVMEGGGAYNANSALQASGAALALPEFGQAAADTPVEDGERPVVIADYGASEGRNSLIPIQVGVRALRTRLGLERAICVVHIDQPSNDFSTLFATVESASESYASGDANVFPSAVGRSFYRTVLPNAHVDLGWSSYAAQWLSRIPGPVPGHIIAFRSIGTLRQAFADQGRSDWETFLSLRAAELRTGGRFVICLPALDEGGLHPAAVLYDAANLVIGEMLSEGAIAADERERMCIAAYIRTPAETLAAFAEGGSRVGLRLLNSRFSQLEDSGWTTYRKDGNAEALAARRAGFFRATFGPSLAGALNLRNAGAARKAFADRLESGMRRHLAGNLAPIKSIVAILSLAKI